MLCNIFLGEEQKKALETELQLLKEKLAPTESAVVEAASKLKKLQVTNPKPKPRIGKEMQECINKYWT